MNNNPNKDNSSVFLEKLYSVHNSFPIMFLSFDKDGTIINANDFLLKQTGYALEQLLGAKITNYLCPSSAQKLSKILNRAIQSGPICEELSLKLVHSEGKYLEVQLSATHLTNDSGQYLASIGIFSDISEIKQKEIALSESEQKYRLMVENTSEFIVRIDLNFRLTFASSSFFERFNITEEEALGKDFLHLIGQHNEKEIDRINTNLHFPPHSTYLENYVVLNKNEYCHAWSLKAIINDENNIESFVAVGRDVTNQKRSEKALVDSERRYRSIAETSIAGITRGNKDDIITYTNQALCSMLEYSHHELMGMKYISLFPEDQRDVFVQQSLQRRSGKSNVYESELITASGKRISVLISASPLLDEKNELEETMAVIVDISRLKETEEKLKEADKLKSAFLANMSHEIRNPMNGIIGFADLLRFPDISVEQRNEYIDLISSSCKVLLNLIEDIIDISKIEAGQMVIKENVTFINDVMNHLYLQFREKRFQDDKGHIEIKLNCAESDPDFSIRTDSVRLNQIISNLLENALKFTKEGTIEMGYSTDNIKQVLFYVKDSGIGLPKDKQQVIFDRFRQVDEDPAIRKFGGAGLGLAISKNLVELLGGTMWVESELDKGSTFYFTLPNTRCCDEELSEQNKSDEPNRNLDWSKKTVLIAEDEETNFLLLQKILSKTSINLIWAKDGEEAIEAVYSRDDIDLVLLDIKMPKMSGYEVLKRIKEYKPDLPVIAQTAYAMSEEKDKSLKLGCDDYLTKPIKQDKLLLALQNYFQEQN